MSEGHRCTVIQRRGYFWVFCTCGFRRGPLRGQGDAFDLQRWHMELPERSLDPLLRVVPGQRPFVIDRPL